MNASTSLPSLTHDCSACSALCCVMLPFDAEQGFGFDKEAGTPCKHLGDDFGCSIHTNLEQKGFRGCIHYSCFGAGQRVTKLFGESNWKASPERLHEIHAVFMRMFKLHEQLFLLETARKNLASVEWQQRLATRQQELNALCVEVEKQNPVEIDAATTKTMSLLRHLATEPVIVALRNKPIARE